MIRLRKLSLSGFRSFEAPAEIEFPESGLTLIRGLNLDSGDSSGSGKTSLILAVQYLLGGCPYPSTELRTWGSETPPKVKAVFDTSKGVLEVERANGLSLKLNGKPIGGSAKLAEAELNSIFQMDSETRALVTYRGQRKPGYFLSMTDSEKKEFLSGLLGLDKFEQAAEQAGQNVRGLENTLQSQIARAEAGEEQLKTVEAVIGPEVDLSRIPILREEATRARARADEAKAVYAEIQAKLKVCNDRIRKAESIDYSNKSAHAAGKRDLEWQLEQAKVALSKVKNLKKAIAETTYKIQSLKADTCPTCHQVVDAEAEAIKKLACEWTSSAAAMEAECDIHRSVAAGLCGLEDQLAAYPVFQPNPIISKLEALKKDIEAELKDANIGDCVDGTYYMEIGHLEAQARHREERVKKFEDFKNTLETWRTAIVDTRSKMDAEADFQKLVGHEGFLGAIFDEVLADISSAANDILQGISNVRHVSIRFNSQKETKAGKVQKKIVPVISIGEHDVKPESGLSGGMMAAVELAVDLAVGDVVSRRRGVYPGWLILDESFEGLGKTSKQSCMEMLQNYAKDRLVLIIDHSSELSACFGQVIEVELMSNRSRIKQ